MLDKKDNRQDKYAVAYIRTLLNLITLLREGMFHMKVDDKYKFDLLNIRKGKWSPGTVLDWAEELKVTAARELESCRHEQNIVEVNDFLIDVRRRYW